jgi:membrane protease YdiL (CAAX protease family)
MDDSDDTPPHPLLAPLKVIESLVPARFPLLRLALPTQLLALASAYVLSRLLLIDAPPLGCPGGLVRGLTVMVVGEATFLAAVLVLRPLAGEVKLPGYLERLLAALRKTSPVDLVATCALVGFAEEAVFRGVVTPLLGPFLAAALFGAVHRPRAVFHWLAVSSLGLLLAYEVRVTGGLFIPMLHHALHDLVALSVLHVILKNNPDVRLG